MRAERSQSSEVNTDYGMITGLVRYVYIMERWELMIPRSQEIIILSTIFKALINDQNKERIP